MEEMMTALAKTNGGAAPIEKYGGYTAEQVKLLKNTIMKNDDFTDDEMSLFLQVASRKGLDPFSGQIHAVKRAGKMGIQTGIDGFRLVAQRTGERDGMDPPQWCGKDGVWKDVWLEKEPPAAARVVVYRKGHSKPYHGIATWDFYRQSYFDKTSKQHKLTPMWAKGGAHMLAKCAEALALREAFPAELSGLYTREEMAQADNDRPKVAAALDDGAPPSEPSDEAKALANQVAQLGSQSDYETFMELEGWHLRHMDMVDNAHVWQALKSHKPKSVTVQMLREWMESAPAPRAMDVHAEPEPAVDGDTGEPAEWVREEPEGDVDRSWSLDFGKHKGTPISEVPGGYLEWLVKSKEEKLDSSKYRERDKELIANIRAELACRDGGNDPDPDDVNADWGMG